MSHPFGVFIVFERSVHICRFQLIAEPWKLVGWLSNRSIKSNAGTKGGGVQLLVFFGKHLNKSRPHDPQATFLPSALRKCQHVDAVAKKTLESIDHPCQLVHALDIRRSRRRRVANIARRIIRSFVWAIVKFDVAKKVLTVPGWTQGSKTKQRYTIQYTQK